MKEIDCEYTNEVVCPYCGHEESESYEYLIGSPEELHCECGECGKKFFVNVHYSYDFTSVKSCEENNEQCNWYKDEYCWKCSKCDCESYREESPIPRGAVTK